MPDFDENKDWQSYKNLVFEHSDTCPSRVYRQLREGSFAPEDRHIKPSFPIKMAVCAYILDKDKNLMVTKRPDHLKIFPNVWVLPGGLVEPHESLETALFREIEEEVGLTFEF